jgi:hypothetical protein
VFHNHNFFQAISSGESEGEQAAQEDETRRGCRQKSIRYEVMIAHGTPANSSEFIKVFETNALVPYLIPSHLNYNISFNMNKWY